MKRYDLESCDGESGRCRANMSPEPDGEWVAAAGAAAALRERDEAVALLRRMTLKGYHDSIDLTDMTFAMEDAAKFLARVDGEAGDGN